MKQYDITPISMLQRLVSTIKSKLALIAFSGKLSDADNDMDFKPVKELTLAEYEALPEDKDEKDVMYMIKDAYTDDNLKKLQIELTGDVTGESVYDPETEKNTIATVRRGCNIYRSNAVSTDPGWYKVAETIKIINENNLNISFLVNYGRPLDSSRNIGILKVLCRTSSTGVIGYIKNVWGFANSEIKPADFVAIGTAEEDGCVFALYVKNDTAYQVINFTVLDEFNGEIYNSRDWILYDYVGSEDAVSEIPEANFHVTSTLNEIQNPITSLLTPLSPNNMSDISDFNNYTINGVYANGGTNSGAVNAPNPADNGYLIVIRYGSGGVWQFWIGCYKDSHVLMRRYRNPSTTNWTAWENMATRVKGAAEESYRTGDVNLTPANIGAVNKAGDVMSGELILQKGSIVSEHHGSYGVSGYIVFAQLKVVGIYANYPVMLEIAGRDRFTTKLSIVFGNSGSLDPVLSNFTKIYDLSSDQNEYFIKKVATSTWQLCTKKREPYDTITITSFHNVNKSFISYTQMNEHINTADFVESEWTKATLSGHVALADRFPNVGTISLMFPNHQYSTAYLSKIGNLCIVRASVYFNYTAGSIHEATLTLSEASWISLFGEITPNLSFITYTMAGENLNSSSTNIADVSATCSIGINANTRSVIARIVTNKTGVYVVQMSRLYAVSY